MNSSQAAAGRTTTADESSDQDYPKLVHIPPRGSSTDAGKRLTNPSPLSQPDTMADGHGQSPASPAPSSQSPAVKQLAAINQKGKAKSKTSRLRRAFSFGSAAEFRKADEGGDKNEPSRLQKQPTDAELYDAEQERIAQKQEAAGLGASIYGGRLFSGSTDNLSISSTASSASIMIRKMGRGMKRGTRSVAGIFRPKSVIGVPAADSPVPDVSQAAVSAVTVEAEQSKVNINPDPHDVAGGGTGFPHLERNSAAAEEEMQPPVRLGSAGTDRSSSRRSIVGGDRERVEVLAAVRKGILKRESC